MATFHSRRLPHLYAIGRPLFVTWRLHGSLPPNRSFSSPITAGQAFVAMDRLLDNALIGPRYFVRAEIADMMVEAIDYRERHLHHYELHAFVVMANHVHLLITPLIEPSKLMHSLKRFTAGQGNRMMGLGGPFWQDESYDRLVRDDKEFGRIVNYIEMNPVKAGLVEKAEDFRWSSARADWQSSRSLASCPTSYYARMGNKGAEAGAGIAARRNSLR